MIRTYSDNAIMAKARALYGKRLTEQDYDQLLQKKSLAEIAAYLKKETYYAADLQEVREELVHRGQLENLLHRRTLSVYLRLRQYAYQETLFLKMYVMQNEIEQLLLAIRLFNSGSMNRYIVALPGHLARLMSFDLYELAKVSSFDELLAVVEHSPYYRDIATHRPGGPMKMIDITTCEAALLTRYYRTVLELIRSDYKGDTRDTLERLVLHQVGMHNVAVIYRMRRYLKAPRELVEPRIVRVEGVNARLYEKLLAAPDVESMQRVIAGSRTLRRYKLEWEKGAQHLSGQVWHVRKALNRKVFRFSTKPVVVVVSYMALLENEISNLTYIIEGVRYGVPPAETRALLSI